MNDRCWQCCKPLVDAVRRKPVKGIERVTPDGVKVRLHEICADSFDKDWAHLKITAQPKEDRTDD